MWRNGNIQVQLLPVFLSYLRSAIGLLNNNRYLQLKESQDSDSMKSLKVLVIQSCTTFETPWTVSHQALLSMEFFRQEYCQGLPFPSPGNLPNPTIEPDSESEVAQSCPTLCHPVDCTLWTVPCQAPLSMGFSRQEYWSGLPFPSPGDLPDPGIKPRSPTLQADALTYLGLPHYRQFFTIWDTREAHEVPKETQRWQGKQKLGHQKKLHLLPLIVTVNNK